MSKMKRRFIAGFVAAFLLILSLLILIAVIFWQSARDAKCDAEPTDDNRTNRAKGPSSSHQERDGSELTLSSGVSDAVTLGKSRVKVYSSSGSSSSKLPIFKYGDLVTRATEYKRSNPTVDVYVDFAIYELELNLWIGIVPGTDNYGKVSSKAMKDADKLIYILVAAAAANVRVRLVYQNPGGGITYSPDDIHKYIVDEHDFLSRWPKLEIRRPYWFEGGNNGQMHNKFMVVNFYQGDDSDAMRDTTYVSTANAKFVSRVQNGVLVNGNAGLHAAYRKYFEIIWAHSTSIGDPLPPMPLTAGGTADTFREAVRTCHRPPCSCSTGTCVYDPSCSGGGLGCNAEGNPSCRFCGFGTLDACPATCSNLNYKDEHFQAYFYPIPETHCTGDDADAWDAEHNGIVPLVSEFGSAVAQDRYFTMIMYKWNTDGYGTKLFNQLQNAKSKSKNVVVRAAVQRDGDGVAMIDKARKAFGKSVRPSSSSSPYIHAKDYLFGFSVGGAGGTRKYVSVTGSTNAKLNGFCTKSNNQLIITETDTAHPIYSAIFESFKDAYTGYNSVVNKI